MNKPITLCDRCDEVARCLLDYDGIPCRRNRTVEPTHADRIRAKTDEELADFLGTLPCCPPGMDLAELCYPLDSCEGTALHMKCWLKWLRQEVST